MNKKTVALLLGGVILLGGLPLLFVKSDFEGADAQAEALIREVAPNFEPWAEPLFEPPSAEVESLLFALQAALGAGAMGFILGQYRERHRQKAAAASKSQQS
ncbi:energy-coupling factor ABC transporter substrate-binding protein [Thermosynechococcus sp. HN-54]|uniref:energy-coupling factor ABC transporter substrate-binding protein n=1 Tax=Thermosynechococcus sp. HN-54 TaxID=2933959 RepID=UPI00202CF0F2|nr:energy-coupling factor ABC transporter substrate-binding protein [Thermosynechococcus sp. HN-54]URR35967.1 energy-coupling factor ABC transporter substrate-binding protein [Thermosynechococcus sp. HN-54]